VSIQGYKSNWRIEKRLERESGITKIIDKQFVDLRMAPGRIQKATCK